MRTRTRKDLEPWDDFEHLAIVKLAEDRSFHDDSSGSKDTALESNRASGEDVVACAHLNHDSSLETGCDSIGNSVAQWIFNTDDADESEVLREIFVRNLN